MKSVPSAFFALLAFGAAGAPTASAAAGGDYPKGVVLAGLQGVFDARPGPVRPFARKLSAGRPAGFSDIVAGTFGWRGGGALPDLDATGSDLYFNGGAFTLDNFKTSRRDGGFYILAVGHENGGGAPAQLTLTNAIVDQGNVGTDRGAVFVGAGSRFTANKVSFLHASATNLNLIGDSSLTDVYFDSPGQNPASDAHTEGPHYFKGKHTVTRAFFDSRGRAPNTSHATGLVYVEAATGDVDVSIKDSIMVGARGLGLYSPIQIFAKPGFHATLRMENVVLQGGTSKEPTQRYVLGGSSVTVQCHLCRDYDTGEVIDGFINVAR